MKWLNAMLKIAFAQHMKSVRRNLEAPIAAQQQVLKTLLTLARPTAWGQHYQLHPGLHVRQLRERVPVQRYEQVQPWIERMLQGETNVLCPGKVTYFSRSSGTTGQRSKYLPVPQRNLRGCHLKGGHDALAIWFDQNPDSRLFDGRRSIIMGGALTPHHQQAKTYVGDVSAIMVRHIPFYGASFVTPSISTALMAHWEEKIARIAQVALQQRISNLSGVPTWTLVLLQKMLEESGADNCSEILPDLELYAHGGVDFTPYRRQFDALFPEGAPAYRNTYNASEGFFATQYAEGDEDMVLLCNNGVYYEFIPRHAWNDEHPVAIPLSEVSVGEDYALVISTTAGLWRYAIGDTIRFTSTQPYRIQITGRTQQYINVFGEEVMVWNADQALDQTCQQLGATIANYTVAPVYMGSKGLQGGHQWLVEFDHPPQDFKKFQQYLDQQLQRINSDYQAKRQHNLALHELTLTPVPGGTFHRWLRAQGKYGGQHKIPRLSNERHTLEAILAHSQNPFIETTD